METNQGLEYVVSTLLRYRKLWIYPALVGLIISAVHVFLIKSPTWTARQSLIMRDDLLGQAYKPGQFNSMESMKSAQETILEVARKPQVIRNALVQLGPASQGWFARQKKEWIDDELIEDVQGSISLGAPNGGEFGKTEVVILNTKGSSRERALKFNQYLLQELEKKISEVRALRLQSMESELTQARDAAALSLDGSISKLREMERRLGADVSTMNGLNSSESGDGGVRREISEIRKEKRLVEAELVSALNTQEMLIAANLNPEKMLATSSEFLKTQPTLEALKKSYVTLQETKSRHDGHYTPEHPLLKSSSDAMLAMRQQMYQELETLNEQVDSHVRVLRTMIRELDEDIEAEMDRLATLGTKRVDHLTINAVVKKKTEFLNQCHSELAEIQALRIAAGQVDWLTHVDSPQVATRPDGMGKKASMLLGTICGLMMGLGLVMLVAPPMEEPTQSRRGRRSDLPRRSSDQRLESPTLDEMVGPTAASAIQTASAATAATVNKGVEFAKSAFAKNHSQDADIIHADEPHRIEDELHLPEEVQNAPENTPVVSESPGVVNKREERALDEKQTGSVSVTIPHLAMDEMDATDQGSGDVPNSDLIDELNLSDSMMEKNVDPLIIPDVTANDLAMAAKPDSVTYPSGSETVVNEDVDQVFAPEESALHDLPTAEPTDSPAAQTEQMRAVPLGSRKLESVLSSLDLAAQGLRRSGPEPEPVDPVPPMEQATDLGESSKWESKSDSIISVPAIDPKSVERESVRSAKLILDEIKAKTEAKQAGAPPAVTGGLEAHQEIQSSQVQPVPEAGESNIQRKIELNAQPARIRPKNSNQRPVDLVKSVDELADDDSVTKIMIEPRTDAQTQRIDSFMASIVPPEASKVDTTPEASQPTQPQHAENPFLKKLPLPKPAAAGHSATAKATEILQSPADGQNPARESNAGSLHHAEGEQESSNKTMPISEQIKNISDSIAKYASKQKLDQSGSDSHDQS